MYNDTIKVANKIISDTDLADIFLKMNDDIIKYTKIAKQEEVQNEKFEFEYQHWTLKRFEGTFTCRVDFYDDTYIKFDNYDSFIIAFNNRLHEMKNIWVRYSYSYLIQEGKNSETMYQHISLNIYESKMDIEVSLRSSDKKMDEVYQLIKEKILNAPERYDRIIQKKSSITSKITFAIGAVPSMVICTLLAFIPLIRQIYGITYVLYPIAVSLLGFVIGGTLFGGRLDSLYSSIVPNKKYAGYDSTNHRSIYRDDVDAYVQKSEIIIGKNIDNIKKRKEITELEEKYSKYIPKELIAILVLSIIVILIGKFI